VNATSRTCVVGLFSLLTSVRAGGQTVDHEGAIAVGGITLKLGMPQAEAISQLAPAYELHHQENSPGTWLVFSKGGPPFRVMGNIAFRGARLTFVSRTWGATAGAQTGNTVAVALHTALRTMPANRLPTCRISTEVTSVVVSTNIWCGRRKFSIMGSSDSSSEATVSESISVDW
jgi:hypothetical protein